MDRSSVIFGNKMPAKVVKKAEKSKKKWIKKFGDDSTRNYSVEITENPQIGNELGVKNIRIADKEDGLNTAEFDRQKGIIVGNIRMGFGHYRISMAIASAAHQLGYTPYWMDLNSFPTTTCTKLIGAQNELYSKGSRLSQKSKLFNKLVWEPLNYEGFKKLSYNAADQKNAELLVPILHDLPKDVPYIATHVWPSQAAVHAGLTHVVNAIPDNWPMGLHLSEGAIHAVQTPFAYLGYKMLNGMGKKPLKGIPESDLYEVGHYIDHELVSNIEEDVAKRIARIQRDEPRRILMSVGGAGAGQKLFLEMMKHLIPYVKEKKAALFLNFGDHKTVYDYLCKQIPNFDKEVTNFFDEYDKLNEFVSKMDNEVVEGIYCIYNSNIFEAVYSTNLLMRKVEMLITKPSELAYYPVVKVMMRHIGGHEVYGAINAQELGDSTFECPDKKSMNEMLDRLLTDDELLIHLNKQIIKLKQEGIYNGGYEVVKLAVNGRKS